LESEITTHGIGSDVVKGQTAQCQAVRIDEKRIQGSTSKAGLERRAPSRGGSGAASEIVDGVTRIRRLELEVELEGIVFSQVRREAAVFKSVIEDTEAATDYEFVCGLVGEANARSKVMILRIAQTFAVLVGDG